MAKPGVKSSEFWLSAIAALVGGVLASGAVSNSLALQLLGGASTLLAALGYSTGRAWIKAAESKSEAIKAAVEKK